MGSICIEGIPTAQPMGAEDNESGGEGREGSQCSRPGSDTEKQPENKKDRRLHPGIQIKDTDGMTAEGFMNQVYTKHTFTNSHLLSTRYYHVTLC